MRSQTTDVYESLKRAIVDGEYLPAESLTEQDLAHQYGVSRNTVKKVLLMLEKENLVVVERNKSAKVRSFSAEDVEQYLEVREVIEGLVIRLAVPHITAEQIGKMEEIFEAMAAHAKANEFVAYSRCNHMFHSMIYDACPNVRAVEMARNLKDQLKKYNFKTILVPGRQTQSIEEHKAILDTIRQGDVELAEILMCRHIASVRTTFRENYALLL